MTLSLFVNTIPGICNEKEGTIAGEGIVTRERQAGTAEEGIGSIVLVVEEARGLVPAYLPSDFTLWKL